MVILCNLMALFNVVLRALTEDFVGSETGSIACALEVEIPLTGRLFFRFGVVETSEDENQDANQKPQGFFEGVSKGLDSGLGRFEDFNRCRGNNEITSSRLDLVSEICMMVMVQTPQRWSSD